jgi:hypothetical protein
MMARQRPGQSWWKNECVYYERNKRQMSMRAVVGAAIEHVRKMFCAAIAIH